MDLIKWCHLHPLLHQLHILQAFTTEGQARIMTQMSFHWVPVSGWRGYNGEVVWSGPVYLNIYWLKKPLFSKLKWHFDIFQMCLWDVDTVHNGTLQNDTLRNGTLHNSTLQYGTFQNSKALQNGSWVKLHITNRYGYKIVHMTKRYMWQNGALS